MSFTSFLSFLVLTSLSSFLFLHFFSFKVIVPPNNSKQIISDVATTSRTILNIVGRVGEDFDHFWLDITWPFGYCSRNDKNCAGVEELPKQFGIHGLWPVDRNGRTLNYNGTDVNITEELEKHPGLLKEMKNNWPNFKKYNNNRKYYWFWSHEWTKHGTCCPKPINDTSINYFKTTINIYKKLNLMGNLTNKSITPDASKMYKQAEFREAIKSSNGNNDVILRCNDGKPKSHSGQILESVTLCVARDANTFIPCNRSKEIKRNESCNESTIKFLSEVIK